MNKLNNLRYFSCWLDSSAIEKNIIPNFFLARFGKILEKSLNAIDMTLMIHFTSLFSKMISKCYSSRCSCYWYYCIDKLTKFLNFVIRFWVLGQQPLSGLIQSIWIPPPLRFLEVSLQHELSCSSGPQKSRLQRWDSKKSF